jgi:superkiller protein 3
MGILTDDDGLIDAALSELKSLPLDLRHRRDPRRDFSYILKQHHLGQVSKQAIIVSPTLTRSVRLASPCPALTVMRTF